MLPLLEFISPRLQSSTDKALCSEKLQGPLKWNQYLKHGSMFSLQHITEAIKLLTHWGRVTHICVGNLTIIGSDNGLSPCRRQAIIWTNAGILLIAPLGINFNEILIGIQTFSFKKIHLKMPSAKWHPFCLGLNVLRFLTVVALGWLLQREN